MKSIKSTKSYIVLLVFQTMLIKPQQKVLLQLKYLYPTHLFQWALRLDMGVADIWGGV